MPLDERSIAITLIDSAGNAFNGSVIYERAMARDVTAMYIISSSRLERTLYNAVCSREGGAIIGFYIVLSIRIRQPKDGAWIYEGMFRPRNVAPAA